MIAALEGFARPICLDQPRWIVPRSVWEEHLPFVLNVVAALEPRVVVDAGTYAGDGYCAVCQAVEVQRLATRCFAMVEPATNGGCVDEAAGAPAALREHHDALYGGFSKLVQDAQERVPEFDDGTVDLLLLDGRKGHPTLRADLDAWSPKMSASGMLLVAGVSGQGGAPRFWGELKASHSHFELHHASGLGLALVGSERSRAIAPLLCATTGDAALVRRFFALLGSRWAFAEALRRDRAELASLRRAVARAEATVAAAEEQRQASLAAFRECEGRLRTIETSRGYRALHRLRVARDVIAPPGSMRRDVLARVTRTGRVPRGDACPASPALEAAPCAASGPAGPVRAQSGHCPVCDRDTRFASDDAWLRDHYRCALCGSIPRERALALVLDARFPEWRRARIHESSPGTPLSRRLAEECPGYVATHFFPGVPGGTVKDGHRCEDLERQTFPDATFDLVVTLDVMEHVLDPESAFREIARTLAPGGAHVFTTPLYADLARSQIRARRRGDGVEFLADPEYHHNPVDPAGSLVTVHWGWDIGDIVLRASGLTTTIHEIRDPPRGVEGEFLHVFASCKASP